MPDTIVLIHGFWVTPRSWEDWKARYESRGYTVLTPAYPGLEVEVEALNEDPSPLEAHVLEEHREPVADLTAEDELVVRHRAQASRPARGGRADLT